MPQYFAPDVHLPLKLNDPARVKQDYLEYRAKVLAERWMPEYRIKKLWQHNFSIKDIRADRHYVLFPNLAQQTKEQELKQKQKKRRALGRKSMYAKLVRAMKDELDLILKYHRLAPRELAEARRLIQWCENMRKSLDNS